MKRATLITALYSAGYHANPDALEDLAPIDAAGPDHARKVYNRGARAWADGVPCTCVRCAAGRTRRDHQLLASASMEE